MNFQVPKETTKGQYTLEAIVSGCEIPTIVLPVAQQSKEEEKKLFRIILLVRIIWYYHQTLLTKLFC